MWSGAPPSLVNTVTPTAIGGSEPGVRRSFAETLDPGPQHVDAAEGVQGQVVDAERAEYAGGPADRRGDVVELEVEEHVVAQVTHGGDGVGTGGRVQLEADLGHAEPRGQLASHARGDDEVVDVECEHQRGPHLVGDPGQLGRVQVGPGAWQRVRKSRSWQPFVMGSADEIAEPVDSMRSAPLLDLVHHDGGRPRVREGRGSDLDR